MSKYLPAIGLEMHAKLKTETKMFCGCRNDPEEKHPNINICPICLGHPGTLPTINKKAIESVLKLGLALGGEIPKSSKFDRKNYFYPDLPKGYQISQYDEPPVRGGELAGVKITRVHLEEDTGALSHANFKSQIPNSKDDYSLVNFNRAGVPLMELVTEPVIHDAQTAVRFAKELQLILRYLGISDADMEKGQMRVEANISLGQMANGKLQMGTKVEIKNLNSFKAVGDAIDYEIKRQEEVLEEGGKIIQETRGWDEFNKKTVSQRQKEESHDYRYFPEPDLPILDLSKFDLEALRAELPELPDAKRSRFVKEYGLSGEKAGMLVGELEFANYFEEVASELKSFLQVTNYQLLFNYLMTDLRGFINAEMIGVKKLKFTPEHFAHLIYLIMEGKITSRAAKDILRKMFETGLDPEEILTQENLGQISEEGELKNVVMKIIEANPNAVADFKKGKSNALQFLVGKTMAELKGRGNPEVIMRILREVLTEK